ncbi:hypothetical protein GIB67_020582 [Kingdonia uniflora]|uniref:Uncharacterized protein n=1 Tax=Kingdonia uniflora TaxID=39325 RepID=A0A7J7NVI0_9MAGN|nr:hypothetical protein GIB67_020582 [Kingdonia uniflora]
MEESEEGKGIERWDATIVNLSELGTNLDSLQKILIKNSVFVDQETFTKASLASHQSRTIEALEQRLESLERELDTDQLKLKLGTCRTRDTYPNLGVIELDATITATARARSEKQEAEAAQRAAELHAQDVIRELENTSSMILVFNFIRIILSSKALQKYGFSYLLLVLLRNVILQIERSLWDTPRQ